MVMPRALTLGVEAALALSTGAAFAGLLSGGPRAARLSRLVTITGAALALLLALLTTGSDTVWLFEALRVNALTQSIKAVVALALLLSVLRPRPGDAYARSRTVDPFFRLVAATALCVAASAGDLLVLWIALDIASLAAIVAVATAGGWNASGPAVRSMLRAWLPASLATALGAILLGALAGATRFTDIGTAWHEISAEPVLFIGIALMVVGIAARVIRFAASGLLALRSTH
jgi:NADH:ubiquinone oxidoreductase subunit 2 (subunit N)